MEGFLRNATHVVPIAGTFEAMNDDDEGRVLALAGLPVAMGEQARFRVDLKQPGFGGRDVEAPGHKSRDHGHGVSVFQEGVWLERRNEEFHRKTVFHEGRAHKSKRTPLGLSDRKLSLNGSRFHRGQPVQMSTTDALENLVELLLLIADHLAIELTYAFSYVRSTWLRKSI